MIWPLLPNERDLLSELFPQRNQAYGAAYFRKTYPTTLVHAFGVSLTFLGVALLGLHLKIRRPIPVEEHWCTDCGVLPDINLSGVYSKSVPVPSPPRYMRNDGGIYKFLPATYPERYTIAFVPPLVVPDSLLPDFTHNWHIVPDRSTTEGEAAEDEATGQSAQLSAALPEQAEGIPSVSPDLGQDSSTFEAWDVQHQPVFPSGMQGMMQYLHKNLRYPEAAHEANIGSQVVVSFVVDTDGSIGAVTVLRDPGYGLGQEVARVVAAMPRWSPGEANGQPVRVRFLLPVRFCIL